MPPEEADTVDPMEVRIPGACLVVGLVLLLVYGFVKGGASGAGDILAAVAIELLLGVPLGVLACFIAAKVLGTDFGLLRTAIVKLAA